MQICLPLAARVGAHAVHAIAALLLMATVWLPLRRGLMPVGRFQAAEVFWFWVVGIWPLIFGMIYLR
jgi:cytochrome c oxidase subunit 3